MRFDGIRTSSFYTPAKNLGLALNAGLLFALSFPPYRLPICLPFAVALLLRGLNGLSVRQGVMVGIACGCVYFGGTLFWLASLFGAGAISLCLILAAFVALFSALTVWLKRTLPEIPLWILAPVVWTAVEWYRSEVFVLKFGWMGLGYALVHAPRLAYGASLLGCYGLSFGVMMAGAWLASAPNSLNLRQRVAWFLPVWALSLYMPRPIPTPQRPLNVRLVQGMPPFTDDLIALSRSKSAAPLDIIVWPEYSLMEDPIRNTELWGQLQSLAKESRSYFLFGGKDQPNAEDEKRFWNTAYLLDPTGRLIGRHVKNHIVHFIQDGIAGTEARSIPTPLGRLGVAICFDMDYPDVARRLTQDGAEVFLVPNMDPEEWSALQRVQHRLMFQMRAIECGRWLARSDVAGGTSLVAPTGREVARIKSAASGYIDVRAGRESGRTLYIRGGWLLPYLCALALGLMSGLGIRRSVLRGWALRKA